MAPLWMLKTSPGKGQGIFAAQAIPSGTRIFRETEGMSITGVGSMPNQAFEQVVLRKVNALSAAKKAKFYSLHEGQREYATREMRIWRANCFGDHQRESVYFTLSKINHSCTPNAETDSYDASDETKDVYAIRDIAADEEVFINYSSAADFVVRTRRQKVLQVVYGFECRCACCCASENEVRLSDARRQIINVLHYALKGYETPAWSSLDTLVPESGDELAKRSQVREMVQPRVQPLSQQQTVAYSVLLAAACEAEGIAGADVARKYRNAATRLLEQVRGEWPIVVLASAKIIKLWIFKADQAWRKARGKTWGTIFSVLAWKERIEETPPLRTVDKVLREILTNPPKYPDGTPRAIFAIGIVERPGSMDEILTLDRKDYDHLKRQEGESAPYKPKNYPVLDEHFPTNPQKVTGNARKLKDTSGGPMEGLIELLSMVQGRMS